VKENHYVIGNPEGAAQYLKKTLGEEAAALAVKWTVTRSGIKEAVKSLPKKGTLKDAVAQIEDALVAEGFAGIAEVEKFKEKGTSKGRLAAVALPADADFPASG
jgi:hypothetical protein